ncbi:MAG TPA: hypothetical protein VLC09_17205, partial [Polyangiaceae bacterium]|nr:hypothetical protein [Polyangiaceae bacterium]
MKPIAFWKLAGPLLALFCLLAPARAEARGVMLITHGETAKDLGEIAPAMKQEIEDGTESGAQMGYCYKYFGLFYLDLWTWAGRPCVHKGDTIWDLPEEVQASYAKIAPDQLKKPFFYSYPEGLCIV